MGGTTTQEQTTTQKIRSCPGWLHDPAMKVIILCQAVCHPCVPMSRVIPVTQLPCIHIVRFWLSQLSRATRHVPGLCSGRESLQAKTSGGEEARYGQEVIHLEL